MTWGKPVCNGQFFPFGEHDILKIIKKIIPQKENNCFVAIVAKIFPQCIMTHNSVISRPASFKFEIFSVRKAKNDVFFCKSTHRCSKTTTNGMTPNTRKHLFFRLETKIFDCLIGLTKIKHGLSQSGDYGVDLYN